MYVTLQDVWLDFAATPILTGISETVYEKDRIGIIGDNGAGKTSLLRLITKEYTPVKGVISIAKNATIGYLEQNTDFKAENTVFEEAKTAFWREINALSEIEQVEQQLINLPNDEQLLERHSWLSTYIETKEAHNIDTKVRKVLNGMSFLPETHQKKVEMLSGGERTALSLVKLLLFAPEVLVLDEPTNHLDVNALSWLEGFLKSYKGAVIVVSHDRYFLDQVANRIWEVSNKKLNSYKGNYSTYLLQKEAEIILQEKQRKADLEKAAKLQDYIDRNLVRASTTKMAQSRRKTLEKMEITEKPYTWHHKMAIQFTFNSQPYEEVVVAKNLSTTFDSKVLFTNISFTVRRGETLVIAGPNGTGKSTLLKMLTGEMLPQNGLVMLGQGVRLSVFSQLQTRMNKQVIEFIWDKYPTFKPLEMRNHLAKFGFFGEDVYKSMEDLSGGELAKLRFAELVLETPNLLFLDEPTNHLDIFTKEALEDALVKYEGTKIVITHDRYFMQRLNSPILHVENGDWQIFDTYLEYINRNKQVQKVENEIVLSNVTTKSTKEERKRKAEMRQKKSTLENLIENLYKDIEKYEAQLQDEAIKNDYEQLFLITTEVSNKRKELDTVYEEWSRLENEME